MAGDDDRRPRMAWTSIVLGLGITMAFTVMLWGLASNLPQGTFAGVARHVMGAWYAAR